MTIELIERHCEEYLEQIPAADSAHDLSHIRRVVSTCRMLSDLEKARSIVTIPAAWLHDCVSLPKDSPKRSESSRMAAERAVEFLSSIDYPEEYLKEVYHAIEAHSFSANIPTRSKEAEVVQDADRLDSLGAIGIIRTIQVGTELGRQLYNPFDPFCENREPRDDVYTLDHFYAKLFKLPAMMNTVAGREEADRRVGMMRAFLAQLGAEVR